MRTALLGIKQATELLNYSATWIKTHHEELGLTPIITGGGHRRYDLHELLKAGDYLKNRQRSWSKKRAA